MSSSGADESGASGRRAGSRRRRTPPKGAKRAGRALRLLLTALGVVMVALVAVATVQFVGGGEAAGEPLPVAVLVEEASQATEVLTDQEIDPRPLSERELFERGADELSSQDLTFTLEASSLEEDCSGAVWGERPEAALAEAGCTQVARAGYVSEEHVGMVALFNLADTEASRALAAALEPQDEEGDGFLTPVSEEPPFDTLGAGYSAAEATVNGHYLMVVWAQELDSESREESASLSAPLVALTNFEMPIYRRLGEHEFVDATGEGTEDTGVAGEPPVEGATEEGAVEESPVDEGAVEEAPVVE